jgi:hypothetical protein
VALLRLLMQPLLEYQPKTAFSFVFHPRFSLSTLGFWRGLISTGLTLCRLLPEDEWSSFEPDVDGLLLTYKLEFEMREFWSRNFSGYVLSWSGQSCTAEGYRSSSVSMSLLSGVFLLPKIQTWCGFVWVYLAVTGSFWRRSRELSLFFRINS